MRFGQGGIEGDSALENISRARRQFFGWGEVQGREIQIATSETDQGQRILRIDGYGTFEHFNGSALRSLLHMFSRVPAFEV